eukprot:TRINITY_DN2490_c0_g1_i1.p1 TRINITY_DN2490_c0_g1~~TRINITY_DN2490_c0_g1_i1.p1  ORF type:complete len:593 (+),score=102.37 TRINITY_DN2490_c0_g1_i1:70-1848(+)
MAINVRTIPFTEVQRHNTPDDCWVVIKGSVYDLTKFHGAHPGGSGPILRAAGTDATEDFEPFHSSDILAEAAQRFLVGRVDPATLPSAQSSAKHAPADSSSADSTPVAATKPVLPQVTSRDTSALSAADALQFPGRHIPAEAVPLSACLNTFDFLPAAKRSMRSDGWAYYESAAEDERTLVENQSSFARVWLCPRTLVGMPPPFPLTLACLGGHRSRLPVYITATALARLAHPVAEVAIQRAAAAAGVVYMVPTLSSSTRREILDARHAGPGPAVHSSVPGNVGEIAPVNAGQSVAAALPASAAAAAGSEDARLHSVAPASWFADTLPAGGGLPQPNWFQLYVNADRGATERMLRDVLERGVTAVFVTVDAPMFGRRERDMRHKYDRAHSAASAQSGHAIQQASKGVAQAIGQWLDGSIDWGTMRWVKRVCAAYGAAVYVKGVQVGADAVMAWRVGLDGVVVSNHGARQVDTARSSVDMLVDIITALDDAGCGRAVRSCGGFDVFLDGGVRRGTDILKALALGATGVGVGRPVLWALAGYGEIGIVRLFAMLEDELRVAMANVGARELKDIVPEMVGRRAGDVIVPVLPARL